MAKEKARKKRKQYCTDCRAGIPRGSICDVCKKARRDLNKIHHEVCETTRAAAKREEIHRGRAAGVNAFLKNRGLM